VVTSRVAQLQSKRFDGFAFLAVGYLPPNPDFDIDKTNAATKKLYGYEIMGYQVYHAEPGSAEMIESHVSSAL
jgi:soluble epoxide hydrolase/lipid-phosphate phosphatase